MGAKKSKASHPRSAGRADAQLIEDLVAANRILAQHGVLDGWGHVSARHNRAPDRYLLRVLARAGAGQREGHSRIRSRQQPGRRARPQPLHRALHPRRNLQGAPRRDGDRAQSRAAADPVRRDHRATQAAVSPRRVHRARRAGVRDPRVVRHDRHADPQFGAGRRARAHARRQAGGADARARRDGGRRRRCRGWSRAASS